MNMLPVALSVSHTGAHIHTYTGSLNALLCCMEKQDCDLFPLRSFQPY